MWSSRTDALTTRFPAALCCLVSIVFESATPHLTSPEGLYHMLPPPYSVTLLPAYKY